MADTDATTEFTVDEIENLIAAALEAEDFEAVTRAMQYMALRWPDRAQLILDAIKVASAMGAEADGT